METDPPALALDLKTGLIPPLWKWQDGTQDPLTCVKLEAVGDRIINSKTVVLKGEEISYCVRRETRNQRSASYCISHRLFRFYE